MQASAYELLKQEIEVQERAVREKRQEVHDAKAFAESEERMLRDLRMDLGRSRDALAVLDNKKYVERDARDGGRVADDLAPQSFPKPRSGSEDEEPMSETPYTDKTLYAQRNGNMGSYLYWFTSCWFCDEGRRVESIAELSQFAQKHQASCGIKEVHYAQGEY